MEFVAGVYHELRTPIAVIRSASENLAQGVRLIYQGRFIPEFSVPPLIGMPFVRRVVERRFRAMIAEIVRRDSLAGNASRK